MQSRPATWVRIRALCVGLIVVLSLTVAQASEAIKHGPGAMASEADHRAFHAATEHCDEASHGHHDATDHDHVSAAVLVPPDLDLHPALQRKLRHETLSFDGAIREGPRRPPRLTMT